MGYSFINILKNSLVNRGGEKNFNKAKTEYLFV